ncbi:MAG: hypothetical protein ACN6OU_02285 [Stenotrophomonas acidaminiphila]
MNDSELTDKARGIARCLTYNDGNHEAAAKHMLHELAHRLDRRSLKVSKKDGRLLLRDALGKSRLMTFKERIAFAIFGALPAEV